MEIKTKYEIGQHIWTINKHNGVVEIYDDYIGWVSYDDEGLTYGLKETCNDIKENDLLLYEETDKLGEKIKQLMQEIRMEEENSNHFSQLD